jgi:hypothetical protein
MVYWQLQIVDACPFINLLAHFEACIFAAFFDPQLVYIKGSMTLNNTGIDLDVNNTL